MIYHHTKRWWRHQQRAWTMLRKNVMKCGPFATRYSVPMIACCFLVAVPLDTSRSVLGPWIWLFARWWGTDSGVMILPTEEKMHVTKKVKTDYYPSTHHPKQVHPSLPIYIVCFYISNRPRHAMITTVESTSHTHTQGCTTMQNKKHKTCTSWRFLCYFFRCNTTVLFVGSFGCAYHFLFVCLIPVSQCLR